MYHKLTQKLSLGVDDMFSQTDGYQLPEAFSWESNIVVIPHKLVNNNLMIVKHISFLFKLPLQFMLDYDFATLFARNSNIFLLDPLILNPLLIEKDKVWLIEENNVQNYYNECWRFSKQEFESNYFPKNLLEESVSSDLSGMSNDDLFKTVNQLFEKELMDVPLDQKQQVERIINTNICKLSRALAQHSNKEYMYFKSMTDQKNPLHIY